MKSKQDKFFTFAKDDLGMWEKCPVCGGDLKRYEHDVVGYFACEENGNHAFLYSVTTLHNQIFEELKEEDMKGRNKYVAVDDGYSTLILESNHPEGFIAHKEQKDNIPAFLVSVTEEYQANSALTLEQAEDMVTFLQQKIKFLKGE